MSDNGDERRAPATGRRRTATLLNTKYPCALPPCDGEFGHGAASRITSGQAMRDQAPRPYPAAKVMIGNQVFHRSDITEGKPGIPLTLTLTIVDVDHGCAPIADANV